jgi:serine phosphatase RsbU (regulator of sigma subunit)
VAEEHGRSRTPPRLTSADSAPIGLGDALSVSAGLADVALSVGAESLQAAADSVTRYLYDNLADGTTGRSRLASARGYVSGPRGALRLVSAVGSGPAHAAGATAPGSVAGELVEALSGPPRERPHSGTGVLRMVSPNGYAVACIEDVHDHDGLARETFLEEGVRGVLGLAVRGPGDTVVALDLYARSSVSPAAADAFAAVAAGMRLAMVPHLDGRADPLRAENTALRELIRVRQRIASRWAPHLEQLSTEVGIPAAVWDLPLSEAIPATERVPAGGTPAVDLVKSHERFSHIARTLQRSLLPPVLPPAPGLELGSVFHPSRAGFDVSGDFYDAFPLGRGDLLLALGDVCGKGAEAAAITAIARHTIRAVAPDMRHPCQILRRLNETMLGHDLDERFCSVVVARVTPIVGGVRMSVCCAGHLAPMVVRADGRVERVGVPGTLLGLFPGIRLLEETVQLHRGDMIVAFTDGVTEASRDGEEFGEERAEKILAGCVGASATEAVSTLLDEVLRFGGQQSRDDIAILALRVATTSTPG